MYIFGEEFSPFCRNLFANGAQFFWTLCILLRGDSLLVSDRQGGQKFFGFVKRCLIYLWVHDLEHNWYIFGIADEKIGQGEC